MYKRKTRDVWEIQGYYGDQYGYEVVTIGETWTEAKELLKCYRENESVPFKIVKKREKIESKEV